MENSNPTTATTEDQYHPVAEKIADTYGVDYSVIEGYLCGETLSAPGTDHAGHANRRFNRWGLH